MAHSNTRAVTSITLCAAEPPGWAEGIVKYLDQQGYHLSRVRTADEHQVSNSDKLPDAVLTIDSTDTLRVYELFSKQTAGKQRPLLVYITDDFSRELPSSFADLILPPLPQHIDQQLQRILDLRNENVALQKQTKQLTSEVNQLRKSLDQQKRLSNEVEVLKTAIVRNVSHELKTPLLQVKSAVALLAEDVENEELISYARGATARLETLVKNITLLGSSLDINPGPVIIRDAVEYARRNLGRIWQHRDDIDRINIEIEDDLPPVQADKQGLSTVLQLLMDNALKFSKDQVEVKIIRAEDAVEISVQDHGIGIAQSDIDTIFETFFQVDRSTTRRYGGTGVGLAIAQLILDHHDSHITVDSQIGKGSTFSFTLPTIEM